MHEAGVFRQRGNPRNTHLKVHGSVLCPEPLITAISSCIGVVDIPQIPHVWVYVLPQEEQGSGSDSSEHYEDLEPKEGESGYRSTDSTGGTSILGWFRRTSAERSSSRVEKTRKHRRSVSANELTDCDQDGYLFKRSSTGLTWKRRWCVLKERAFYYYRSVSGQHVKLVLLILHRYARVQCQCVFTCTGILSMVYWFNIFSILLEMLGYWC